VEKTGGDDSVTSRRLNLDIAAALSFEGFGCLTVGKRRTYLNSTPVRQNFHPPQWMVSPAPRFLF
jgi:hypothetical protein